MAYVTIIPYHTTLIPFQTSTQSRSCLVMDDDDVGWHGVIFLRKGYFRKGVFKFVMHIPDGYPDAGPPRVFFISDVRHSPYYIPYQWCSMNDIYDMIRNANGS
jgi:hypothetical protein